MLARVVETTAPPKVIPPRALYRAPPGAAAASRVVTAAAMAGALLPRMTKVTVMELHCQATTLMAPAAIPVVEATVAVNIATVKVEQSCGRGRPVEGREGRFLATAGTGSRMGGRGGAGLLQEDAHLVEGEGDHVAALGKGTVDGQQKGAVQVAAEGDCGVGHRAGVEARGGVGEVCESEQKCAPCLRFPRGSAWNLPLG